MKDILGDYESFIQTIDNGLLALGIDHSELSMMDHVCYRVETQERYQEVLQTLEPHATLLGENEVAGRMIATFELNEYLRAGNWTVPYLELPAPKAGSPYKEGLEHAEFVVTGGLETFMRRHADLSFSFSDKLINPEAGIKQAGISVKFHEQQLGSVVRIEKRLEGVI
jgi:hypothetical protein